MPTYQISVMRLYTVDAKNQDLAEQYALEERGEDEDGAFGVSADHSEIMTCQKI